MAHGIVNITIPIQVRGRLDLDFLNKLFEASGPFMMDMTVTTVKEDRLFSTRLQDHPNITEKTDKVTQILLRPPDPLAVNFQI